MGGSSSSSTILGPGLPIVSALVSLELSEESEPAVLGRLSLTEECDFDRGLEGIGEPASTVGMTRHWPRGHEVNAPPAAVLSSRGRRSLALRNLDNALGVIGWFASGDAVTIVRLVMICGGFGLSGRKSG